MIRAAWLAVPATATAACLSVLAGWQRGGWLPERLLWIAIGVVLVLGAHLLPALCRSYSVLLRCIGAALWAGCVAATCYGHAVFFLMAQQHAGALRADAVVVPASVEPTGRDLGAIATDRAAAVAELMGRCRIDCTERRAAIRARIDALDAEAGEKCRREAAADRVTEAQDRAETRRNVARTDPVTGRLAAVTGIPVSTLDLLAGMLCALTLEGAACLCWALALDSRKQPHERDCRINPMNAAGETNPMDAQAGESQLQDLEPREPTSADVHHGSEPVAPAVTEAVTGDRERVAAEVAAGGVRCTVAGIRRYLGCSQSRALELRRELVNEAG